MWLHVFSTLLKLMIASTIGHCLKKLLKRFITGIVVRLLMFWYFKQEVCIKWGTEMSSYFNITNVVRQGGILSPSLFTIYMDDLSSLLNTSRIGCHISDVCIKLVFMLTLYV